MGNWLENHVPWKVWRINTKADQFALCPGDSITSHAGGHHLRLGSKYNNPLNRGATGEGKLLHALKLGGQ